MSNRACTRRPSARSEALIGTYLAARGLDDDAARAFRAMLERGDTVASTHYVSWLINYEADRGRTQEAMRLATEAADVYSAPGLIAKADLLERLGRYDEAEGMHRRVAERYKDEWSLLAFHQRRRAHDPSGRHAAEADRLRMSLSGGRMIPLTLAASQNEKEPEYGVLVTDPGPDVTRAGLQNGDVIVAVRGWRIRDFQQFLSAERFSDDPQSTFLAWRGGRYIQARGLFKHHFISGEFINYRKSPS